VAQAWLKASSDIDGFDHPRCAIGLASDEHGMICPLSWANEADRNNIT
jgi:hypothetical protein